MLFTLLLINPRRSLKKLNLTLNVETWPFANTFLGTRLVCTCTIIGAYEVQILFLYCEVLYLQVQPSTSQPSSFQKVNTFSAQVQPLRTKYLKELHEKEEKLAQREAALEKEKLQVEDQINSIKSNSRDEALHKEGLARLHEKLKNREKDMATRRDQISLDIAKQTEVTRKAKKFRLRSAGAIGKFLRLQTKSSAWNKLKEEAEEKRLRSEAEQKVREDIVEHHREHMEAIGFQCGASTPCVFYHPVSGA